MKKDFSLGQTVSFTRSNGKVEEGKITFIDCDILTVQWTSQDGTKIGRKTLLQSEVHSKATVDHRIAWLNNKHKIISAIIFFSIVFCLILFIDYYLHLKQVVEIDL